MAFTIPAISAIGTRLKQAYRAYLPGTDALVEPNNLSVSAKTFALGLYEAYQRILFLYRQLFASTADAEHLEKRHAAEYGLQRKPSTGAAGLVIVAQAAGDDSELPVGLRFARDDGIVFAAISSTNASNAAFAVAVQCTGTGAATNTDAGTPLAILPQAGVTLAATSALVDDGGLGGGADIEPIEALRGRVLQRKRFTPMAGANSDYVRWATEVPGCTRAFASGFANQPPGVVIYPLFDLTRDKGFPTQADLDAVAAHLDLTRPVTARRFVVAATPMQVDIVLAGLQADTQANRDAIAAQLAASFAQLAAVGTVDDPVTVYRNWVTAPIDRVLGGSGYTLVQPAAHLPVPTGSLPFLGTVTYR